MKIGIVTFWQTRDNYGQMLQCFALQQKLKEMGHDPFLIRYQHMDHDNPLIDKFRYFCSQLLQLRLGRLVLKRKQLPPMTDKEAVREFENFKKTRLEVSEAVYSSLKELKSNPPTADCYIVGSDQVWRKTLTYWESRVFYLDFGRKDIPRVAYAASFSKNRIPFYEKGILRGLLKRFDAIFVREKTGVKLCNDIGIRAEWVCDPTLLLQKNDYFSLFQLSNCQKKQLFVYSLNISAPEEIYWESLKAETDRRGLSIVVTPSSGYIPAIELYGDGVDYQYCTIHEWLDNIANSKIVVTTSFHGVVFCLLFHTNFVFIPLSGRFSRGNNRILDLFEYLGITDRICDSEALVEKVLSTDIDWNSIDERIYSFRGESRTFLCEALTNFRL